jgi:hypothetical protein
MYPEPLTIMPKLLTEFCCGFPVASSCQECGKEGTQAAHANWSWSGKGMGIKAHDMYVAALCPECHYALDQGKDMQKWEREELWLRAWRKTIYELFERGLVDVRAKT